MSDLISFVTPPAATGANSMQSAASLSSNFDTFLTILTAQIQNQDPLEPMDSTQFTDQLVQFSGVEQQIRVNTQLETLISATNSGACPSSRTPPGTSVFTRTPSGAQYSASQRVK